MARTIYRGTPDGTQRDFKKDNVMLSRHNTKDAGVAASRTIAIVNQPSQLVVHLTNGEIETEYTYGDDPYPPKG